MKTKRDLDQVFTVFCKRVGLHQSTGGSDAGYVLESYGAGRPRSFVLARIHADRSRSYPFGERFRSIDRLYEVLGFTIDVAGHQDRLIDETP